ncbi:hypothetical protein H5410_064740 [Solanum commersonii]|uniref:DUF4283 domain-containing protein n=1 Tax=Solanum commersonii TaxID=4109 RepID=A0A9J5VYK4_SOLCO|nr:hypothetical protein H5410_064740 [Solanum commersonii]
MKAIRGNDSTNQELQHTKNLDESIVPIERTEVAISGNFTEKSPELRLQIRPSSHQIHEDLTTGVCSPGEGVHLKAIPSKMDGPIVGDKNFDEQAAGKSKSNGHDIRGNYSMDEAVHLTNISNNSGQQHNQKEIQASLIASTTKQQTEVEQLNCSNEAEHQRTYSRDHAGPNGDTIVEVIDVESSPQFSFGVKPMDTLASKEGQQRPGKTINYVNEIHYDQMQGHHAGATNSQRKKSNEADIQASMDSHANSNRDVVNLSSGETHLNDNAKGQKSIKLNDQERLRGTSNPNNMGIKIRIGRELTVNLKYLIKEKILILITITRTSLKSPAIMIDTISPIKKTNKPPIPINPKSQAIQMITKKLTDQRNELRLYKGYILGPPKLRQIHATQATNIEVVPPRHTTKQGQPAVIYDMDDFMNKLTVDCKYTLIGKFSNTMPKIGLIRKSFILQTQLNGGVNIAHYNARHVFIDLDNELDYNTVWTQQRMTIEASIKRTRASMAKVKVQVDLTKDRPRHVWIGLDDEDLTIGRWQPIEYENIPPYCAYCKHQGHMIDDCNFKIRDEDFKRRKELGAELKNMNKGEQGQQGREHRQIKTREHEEQQQQQKTINSNKEP